MWNPRDFVPQIDEFSSSTSTPRGFDKAFLIGAKLTGGHLLDVLPGKSLSVVKSCETDETGWPFGVQMGV